MTNYPEIDDVKTVAVVGCGTIGASWAAWFLARGLAVTASDPGPDAEAFLRDYVARAWPHLGRLGVATGGVDAALARIRFEADPAAAAEGADFVQESAPERVELKQDLLARIEEGLDETRIIASSTSGFGVTAMQARMRAPGRLVVGHPFNPPHLIPLVEVVGGGRTDEAAVQWALRFYDAIGKRAIHIRKEVRGHLANRLQAALWREAVSLVAEGVASVEDVDAAIAHGPGLRWAIYGPHLTFHLAGGRGGMSHFIDHLAEPMESWWDTLGEPRLTPDTAARIVEGVNEEIGARSFDDLVAERDERLIALLQMKARPLVR